MYLRCFIFLALVSSCGPRESGKPRKQETAWKEYRWTKIIDSLSLADSGSLQILNVRDTIWAIQPGGIFYSIDGREFTPSNPATKSSKTFSDYVFFNNRLITITKRTAAGGDEECICMESTDFKNWNVHKTSLPIQPRYQPIYFNGKLWLYTHAGSGSTTATAWNSIDGMQWKLVADSLPLPVEGPHLLIVLRKKLLLISSYCYQSEDGVHWQLLPLPSPASLPSRSIVSFNDMIWLFGSSKPANDSSAIYFSKNLKTWDSMPAPWAARANPAVCIFRARVLLIGGRTPATAGTPAGDSFLKDGWELRTIDKPVK